MESPSREKSSETVADADLVETLRKELSEANEAMYKIHRHLDQQLKIATRVHQSLLPSAVRHPRIHVDVRYLSANKLGSDYFQVRLQNNSSACYVTMCHVSGDGIAPALLASRISSEARHFIEEEYCPSDMVHAMNRFIYEYFRDEQRHVSFISARIGLNNRTITYSGAGHPGPMLLRPGHGLVQRMVSQHCSLGLNPDILTDQSECFLQANVGDRLLFFADGITQTSDANSGFLGQNGLAKFAVDTLSHNVFETLDAIVDQVDHFRGCAAKEDVTLVVAEIK